jgi:hypothetical protein
MFFDSCRIRGVGPALELIPPKLRKPYLEAVQLSIAPWWDPEAIWQHWPKLVSEMHSSDPSHAVLSYENLNYQA